MKASKDRALALDAKAICKRGRKIIGGVAFESLVVYVAFDERGRQISDERTTALAAWNDALKRLQKRKRR